MDVMFIDAKVKMDIALDNDTIDYCKQFKVLAVYGSVQFASQLDVVIKQLEEAGVKVITSQPHRTNKEFQILGCDSEFKDLNLKEQPDAFLYIGDGMFHPHALVLAQKDMNSFKEVVCFDPIQNEKTVLGIERIQKVLRKYKASLIKFLSSDSIGILVTTKPGQQQMRPAKLLKEKYPSKTFYYFIENTIDFRRLEDYPFIQAWVNTACPRLGFEDNAEISPVLINVNDAHNAEEILSKESFLTKN